MSCRRTCSASSPSTTAAQAGRGPRTLLPPLGPEPGPTREAAAGKSDNALRPLKLPLGPELGPVWGCVPVTLSLQGMAWDSQSSGLGRAGAA